MITIQQPTYFPMLTPPVFSAVGHMITNTAPPTEGQFVSSVYGTTDGRIAIAVGNSMDNNKILIADVCDGTLFPTGGISLAGVDAGRPMLAVPDAASNSLYVCYPGHEPTYANAGILEFDLTTSALLSSRELAGVGNVDVVHLAYDTTQDCHYVAGSDAHVFERIVFLKLSSDLSTVVWENGVSYGPINIQVLGGRGAMAPLANGTLGAYVSTVASTNPIGNRSGGFGYWMRPQAQ